MSVASIVLLVAMPRSAPAQRLNGLRAGLGGTSARSDGPAARRSRPLPDSVVQSRWKTGAIIGGGVGIVIGFFIDAVQRGSSDDPYRTFNYRAALISTFAFAVIGALIGSEIHR